MSVKRSVEDRKLEALGFDTHLALVKLENDRPPPEDRLKKTGKRRKIRRLGREESAGKASSKSFVILWGTSVGVLLFLILCVNPNRLLTNFLSTYEEQYNTIVHGDPDYCGQNLNARELFSKIRPQLLNQEGALEQLENLFERQDNVTAIALVGPTGVGKTHLSNLLKENFPWPENVQMHFWSEHHGNVPSKDLQLKRLFAFLSGCGRNIIVIDNLQPSDKQFVEEFTKKAELAVIERGKEQSPKLVVIYAFTIKSYSTTHRQEFEHNFNDLQSFNANISTVNLRMFNEEDLIACVRHEVDKFNLTVSDSGIRDILKSIDVQRSGCKNVHSKVMLYAKN